MAARRTGRMTGSDPSRSSAARAAAIAEQLHHECSILLELYVSRGAVAVLLLLSPQFQPASRSQYEWRNEDVNNEEKRVCECVGGCGGK